MDTPINDNLGFNKVELESITHSFINSLLGKLDSACRIIDEFVNSLYCWVIDYIKDNINLNYIENIKMIYNQSDNIIKENMHMISEYINIISSKIFNLLKPVKDFAEERIMEIKNILVTLSVESINSLGFEQDFESFSDIKGYIYDEIRKVIPFVNMIREYAEDILSPFFVIFNLVMDFFRGEYILSIKEILSELKMMFNKISYDFKIKNLFEGLKHEPLIIEVEAWLVFSLMTFIFDIFNMFYSLGASIGYALSVLASPYAIASYLAGVGFGIIAIVDILLFDYWWQFTLFDFGRPRDIELGWESFSMGVIAPGIYGILSIILTLAAVPNPLNPQLLLSIPDFISVYYGSRYHETGGESPRVRWDLIFESISGE